MIKLLLRKFKLNHVQVIVPLAVVIAALVACVRQHSQSDQSPSSGMMARGSCEGRFDSVDYDCIREIFNTIPMSKLIKIFPPSDPSIQRYVSELVTGNWPQWVLDDIKKEKGEKNYDKRLVSYYYAFLKFPSRLHQWLKEGKSRINGGPKPIVLDRISIFGMFGDDKYIYYNNIKGDKYYKHFILFDLKKGKIIAKIKDTFTEAPQERIYEGGIHDLGNGTFAMVLNYYVPVPNSCKFLQGTEIMVLEWVPSWISYFGSLKLVYRVDAPKDNYQRSYLGHVEDKLLTWRQQTIEGQEFDVVETWNQNGMQQSITLNSNLWEKSKLLEYPLEWEAGLPEMLKSLAEQGIKIDPKNIDDKYRQDIYGTRLDNYTTINFKNGNMNIVFDRLNRKQSISLGASSSFSQIRTVSNNGDIIIKLGIATYYINIWTIMKEVVADMDRLGAL